jgi:hypothetical protein
MILDTQALNKKLSKFQINELKNLLNNPSHITRVSVSTVNNKRFSTNIVNPVTFEVDYTDWERTSPELIITAYSCTSVSAGLPCLINMVKFDSRDELTDPSFTYEDYNSILGTLEDLFQCSIEELTDGHFTYL